MKQTLEQAAIEAVEKHYGMDAYPLFRWNNWGNGRL